MSTHNTHKQQSGRVAGSETSQKQKLLSPRQANPLRRGFDLRRAVVHDAVSNVVVHLSSPELGAILITLLTIDVGCGQERNHLLPAFAL